MDKDRIAGAGKEMKGGIKEKAGQALGDSKMQSEGSGEKLGGKIQNTVGGMKDAVKDAFKGD